MLIKIKRSEESGASEHRAWGMEGFLIAHLLFIIAHLRISDIKALHDE
jgi:hypothetical protein